MTAAAVERRFFDPAAVQRKYHLARQRRSRTVDVGIVAFAGVAGAIRASVEVVRAPRPRFPRWPLQRLGELLWRLVPPAVFRILEPQVDWEAVSKWLFNRRRAARAGVP